MHVLLDQTWLCMGVCFALANLARYRRGLVKTATPDVREEWVGLNVLITRKYSIRVIGGSHQVTLLLNADRVVLPIHYTKMAAPVLQSDPANPSIPQPGPSRSATVADEEEELAAETGTNVGPGPATAPEQTQAPEVPEEEEEIDPNAIPAYACETLYIQNLNEKVQTPGELSFWSV